VSALIGAEAALIILPLLLRTNGYDKMNLTITSAGRKKRTMLPLLVVLFLISYSLLTMLVVEQGRTIDSQRSLIHLLFGNSIQLSATRVAGHQNQADEKSKPEQDSAQTQSQSPSPQVTQGQAPSAQVPQNPSKPQANVQAGRGSHKAQKAVPPPAEMTDPSDMRRVSFSI
jgi:hypothetical protein